MFVCCFRLANASALGASPSTAAVSSRGTVVGGAATPTNSAPGAGGGTGGGASAGFNYSKHPSTTTVIESAAGGGVAGSSSSPFFGTNQRKSSSSFAVAASGIVNAGPGPGTGTGTGTATPHTHLDHGSAPGSAHHSHHQHHSQHHSSQQHHHHHRGATIGSQLPEFDDDIKAYKTELERREEFLTGVQRNYQALTILVSKSVRENDELSRSLNDALGKIKELEMEKKVLMSSSYSTQNISNENKQLRDSQYVLRLRLRLR